MLRLLFEFARLLSIVPAVFGTLYNLYYVLWPPEGLLWWRIEYVVAALWSILTGWQCLMLTTGLLKRWRVYYTPLSNLIRLLSLQAICWPATHFTLTILEHHKRPLICWVVIGTTTCWSRSIQMWVTSNIIVSPHPHHPVRESPVRSTSPSQRRDRERELVVERERMKMGRKRKWDWNAVVIFCMLPAGVLYFVTAWVELLRREFELRTCPSS